MASVQIQLYDNSLPSLARFPTKKDTARGPPPPPGVSFEEIPWRGHGGRAPTMSSVEFDRQLDKISMWLEDWDHEQRCIIVEGILRRSNYVQFQFLYTSLQPILHRDFMYTAKSQYPSLDFQPVSTHTSRRLKEKLIFTRQDDFHRISSAHFKNDEEVKQLIHPKQSEKLPGISYKSKHQTGSASNVDSPDGSSKKKSRRVPHQSSSSRISVERWVGDGTKPLYDSLPHIRYIEMPIRRHIQDESSTIVRSVHKSASTQVSHAATQQADVNQRTKAKVMTKGKFKLNLEPASLPEEGKILYNWYTQGWTDVKRNEFLHKFLLKLDPRQHYFISSFLAARQHKDFISLLPRDIAIRILGYLTVKELLTCCKVSKTWNNLASDNGLWKSICDLVKLEVPIGEKPEWKRIYKENKFLRVNWNDGKCRMKDLKGHTDTVTCVIFDLNRVASGSLDKTIRVWDMKTGKCTHNLKGHVKGVWCLNFFTNYLLVSGSYDGTIRVWNLRTSKLQKTILAHDGPIWAMVRHNDTLVTASQDKTAKIWDINRCLHQNSLLGHSSAIFAVDMNEDGRLVITGSADKSAKIWNLSTGRCLRWISVSQTTSVMAVSYSRGYLACSYGETICLYKVDGPTKLIRKYCDTKNEHMKRIECLELDMSDPEEGQGMIVSAGKDGAVKYWDIQKDKSVQTFLGHKGLMVNAIHFDELRIASAAGDNKIRLWDFNV